MYRPKKDSPPPQETDERFPSGPWIGFWLQRHVAGRQWMRELNLRFRDGKVEGEGEDYVGEFVITGAYDLADGAARFFKTYVGSHTVIYDGMNQNDGQWLWGTWQIVAERGGFHIWPKGVDDPTRRRTGAEAEVPGELVGATR